MFNPKNKCVFIFNSTALITASFFVINLTPIAFDYFSDRSVIDEGYKEYLGEIAKIYALHPERRKDELESVTDGIRYKASFEFKKVGEGASCVKATSVKNDRFAELDNFLGKKLPSITISHCSF